MMTTGIVNTPKTGLITPPTKSPSEKFGTSLNTPKIDLSGMFDWFTDLWDRLTGQTAENERTEKTNEANKESIKDTNATNLQIAEDTNATNRDIAHENLEHQRELFEYNKALQQEIFDREDTSYARTAKDMMNAGLNPLTMQGTNGAGEAIAQSPLNNQFQAQMPAPMQAYQAQKAQTMSSPIQAISAFSSVLGTVVNSIESVKTGRIQRDSLQAQSDINRINAFLSNIDKGVIYNAETGKLDLDDSTFEKYLSEKAKEKDYNIQRMEKDMREWEHMRKTNKFETDTDIEKMLTAVQDWLTSGRGEAMWNDLKEKFPLLSLLDEYAKNLMPNKQKYDTEVKGSNGKTRYYKNGKEVDVNGNPIK